MLTYWVSESRADFNMTNSEIYFAEMKRMKRLIKKPEV